MSPQKPKETPWVEEIPFPSEQMRTAGGPPSLPPVPCCPQAAPKTTLVTSPVISGSARASKRPSRELEKLDKCP